MVVKVGSSSLTTAAGGLDGDRLDALVDALAAQAAAGREVVLVSSGAIAAGLAPLGLPRRPRRPGHPAGRGQRRAGPADRPVHRAFARHGRTVGQVLLTVDDVTRRGHYRNAYRTLRRLLDLGALPIVNENDTVATDEIRFGDNDRLAALVAALVHADAAGFVVRCGRAVHRRPRRPGSPPDRAGPRRARLGRRRLGRAGRAGVGTGGMVTKVEAARIATGAGIPVVLTSAAQAGPALAGEPVGTLFHRLRAAAAARLLWLAHATAPAGGCTWTTGR